MEKLDEFSKRIYSLFDVLALAKNNNYRCGACSPYQIYYSYVGRHDQPDVYDKRPCLVIEDFGNKVSVLKLTSTNKNTYKIKAIDDLSLNGDSYIRLDDEPYMVNKDWITMYVGELNETDISCIDNYFLKKNNYEKI